MKKSILFAFLLLSIFACKKDKTDPRTDAQIAADDKAAIEKYLSDKGLTAQTGSKGLYYIIEKEGTGTRPTINNNVTVTYKGYYTDGTVFDQTPGTSVAQLWLGQVIEGWQLGIPLIKEEGKIKLLIPSALGYGREPGNGIRESAVLIFDVELVLVQ